MTACANCGTEIEGGDACPRCGTPIPAERKARALAFTSGLIATVLGLGASVEMIVDYAAHGSFGWSLIGLASSVEAWILVGYPMIAFRRPALFLAAMGASALAYLKLLEALTGGSWFLPLALPMALAAFASAALTVFLCRKARQRGPNVAAFILLGCAIACFAVENALSLHFAGAWSFTWSAIVAASALPTALLLLGIQGRVGPASRDSRP